MSSLLISACARSANKEGADRPQAPSPGVTVVTSPNLASWLPEGAPDGDDRVPSGVDKDLVVFCSWKGEGRPRIFYVIVRSSNHPGSCTNAGSLTCADMTIEESRNPLWKVVGPDISEYTGVQSSNIENSDRLTARTLEPVEAGVQVELRVTSYDWGGSSTLEIFAEGCDRAILK